MQITKLYIRWNVIVTLLAVMWLAAASSAQVTVLHSFNSSDGDSPIGGVILDSAGNLYGTTFYGGTDGIGTVYKLVHKSGGWSEKVLYSFKFDGVDGYQTTAGLLLDGTGNLYGVTQFGGPANFGTVFELSPSASGTWTEKILHDFANGTDGTYPHSALTMDAAGNLYGTTPGGGANGLGIVYELSPGGSGSWTEKVLWTFSGPDGANPFAGLTFDGAGNIYGTTSAGGGSNAACRLGCGTVFELSPAVDGSYSEKVLHNFTKNQMDGHFPYSNLLLDAAGNLYGTALQGGKHGDFGTVYELTPSAGGLWREKILHSFSNNGRDGYYPMATLAMDGAGNLYGTDLTGGAYGQGTVFQLTQTAGVWREKILFSFDPSAQDGYDPVSGLVADSAGNLYGTTLSGGAQTFGTVFELTP